MAGLRDIIVHQDDRIDGGVLHDVVTTQAPAAVTGLADVVAVLRTEADA